MAVCCDFTAGEFCVTEVVVIVAAAAAAAGEVIVVAGCALATDLFVDLLIAETVVPEAALVCFEGDAAVRRRAPPPAPAAPPRPAGVPDDGDDVVAAAATAAAAAAAAAAATELLVVRPGDGEPLFFFWAGLRVLRISHSRHHDQ